MSSILHPIYFAIVPLTATTRAQGIDVSKHDKGFDPGQSKYPMDFIFQRASYGVTRDELFDQIFVGVKKIPVRFAYHYLASYLDYKPQADKFLSVVKDLPFHGYAADFEGAFNTLSLSFAKLTWDWMNYVQDKTGKPVFLYTSLSLYNAWIGPSEATLKIDWDRFPYWQAQWPNIPNPNGTPTMPTKRTGGWDVWQYSDKGTGWGTVRDYPTDLNVYNGTVLDLQKRFGVTIPPAPLPNNDVTTYPYYGITTVSGERYGWKFSIDMMNPEKVRFEVAHTTAPNLVNSTGNMARQKGATIAYNGGDWDKYKTPYMPLDFSVSNGSVYLPRQTFRPSFYVKSDGSVGISHEIKSGVQQALSGVRYIVQDGKTPSYLDGTEAQYTEGHARTIIGQKANGHVMVMIADGLYPNMGMTLKQAALIMIEYGAVTAFDSGGGGDTTRVVEGVLTNSPQDGAERYIPEFLLVYAEKEYEMPTATYEVVSATHALSIRLFHQVTNSTTILSVPIGTKLPATEIWIAPETTALNQKGDIWAYVAYGGKTGWVALVHLGKVYGTYKEIVTEPQPPAEDGVVSIVKSETIQITYESGKIDVFEAKNITFQKV